MSSIESLDTPQTDKIFVTLYPKNPKNVDESKGFSVDKDYSLISSLGKETSMTTTTNTHRNVTTNVSRTTFDYIRDNAGVTRADATIALEHAGYNSGSVTSLIGQMLKSRMVRNENGNLYANQKEYTPLKALVPTFKHTKKRAYKRKEAPAAGLPALALQQPSPIVERQVVVHPALGAPFEWSVDSVLDKLSVKQAMAVYGELRKIFGE